jgi:uncharacterized protein
MIVISDTSPISNLIDLDLVSLLPRLFQQVIIPSVVDEELGRNEDLTFKNKYLAVKATGWLKVVSPSSVEMPLDLQNTRLDAGEKAAIALVLAYDADLLPIDERAGFRVAQALNIRTLGVLGILLEAKSQRMIDAIKPFLDRLRDEVGFWISDRVYEKVLLLADERM